MPLSLSLYTYISCVYHHHGDYYYHFHYSYDEYPHLRVCARVYIYLTFAFFFSSRMLLSASYPTHASVTQPHHCAKMRKKANRKKAYLLSRKRYGARKLAKNHAESVSFQFNNIFSLIFKCKVYAARLQDEAAYTRLICLNRGTLMKGK